MKKSRKLSIIVLIISVLLVFGGLISLSFTYLIYPSLIPGYGGEERFHLDSFNNYTTHFPLYATNSRLHLKIEANDSLQIYIDDLNVYNGTIYEITMEPMTSILIILKSNLPVRGRFIFRQEIPWFLKVGSFGTLITGFILVGFSAFFLIRSKKNKRI